MSDIQHKRDALATALQSFVDLCDEAEAVIGSVPVQGSGPRDFSALLDALLPLPIDKDTIQCTNIHTESLALACTQCAVYW
jgi:DNA polymerase